MVKPVAPLGSPGARVVLAPMGDDSVALPLRGDTVSRAGFLPAGGLAGGDGKLAGLGIEGDQLPGYDTQVPGHLQVASAIAAGLADAGVASEPAAAPYALGFIPLATERFDLVVPAGQVGAPEVQGLLRVLSSRWLLDQLASLPGYDPARCGEHLATLAPARRAGRSTS